MLTWLLKESLGGDSKTVMLATISPCAGHVEETLATLRYACQVSQHLESRCVRVPKIISREKRAYKKQQARTIINTARICEDPNARLVRLLREQIKSLEEQLQKRGLRETDELKASDLNQITGDRATQRVEQLENELCCLRSRLAEVFRQNDASWHDKLADAEIKRARAEEILANYGLSDTKNPQQPCLINVNQVRILFCVPVSWFQWW